MANNRETIIDKFYFVGATELVASGSVSPIPWRETVVAGGVITGVADGAQLALDATSEAQSARLSFADILTYDIDELLWAEFVVKFTSAALTNVSAIIGMASAGNATINTIANQASFGINGTTALFCESDDGTTDNDDIATGLTLTTATWNRLRIDFSTGVTTVSPGTSLGGKSNILFTAGVNGGAMRPVAQGTRFSLAAYTGGLQPYVQLQKASSTDVASLIVSSICVGRKDH